MRGSISIPLSDDDIGSMLSSMFPAITTKWCYASDHVNKIKIINANQFIICTNMFSRFLDWDLHKPRGSSIHITILSSNDAANAALGRGKLEKDGN
jgi:hypothetical protein